MAISVSFYNVSDDPKCTYKNLGEATHSASAVPYEPIDYIRPRLILDYDSDIESSNYCYISDWERYYFIRKRDLVNGQKMVITLEEDELMTFRSQTDLLPCYILRTATQTAVTEYIYDDRSPCMIQSWTASFYPDDATHNTLTPSTSWILITAG